MFETLRNAWRLPDLRKKMLFTLFIILVFRFGSAIPVPFIDIEGLKEFFKSAAENTDGVGLFQTIFGQIDMFTGGALQNATLFAMSITPYINASIIMQLLTIAIPALERLQKDGGDDGRKKIASITRFVTVGLGLLQGFVYYVALKNYNLISDRSWWAAIVVILSFTAGTALIMWLGEQVTENGIGNGISIILFAGIISRGPSALYSLFLNLSTDLSVTNILVFLGVIALAVGIIAFVVFMQNAERRIPVQYAKRMVGRKMYGGQSTYLPIKVNMNGVLPIIFAGSLLSLPITILALIPGAQTSAFGKGFLNVVGYGKPLYAAFYMLLILGFSYFYASIQFNPIEIGNNLRKNGGSIMGLRPGTTTSQYILKIMNKVTFLGALFLGVIAILPIAITWLPIASIPKGLGIGGTSVLIVVGVAIETVKQLESQMLMRHYKGFLE